MRRALQSCFSEYQMTGAQYWVLARLPAEGISLTALAHQADADPANISGIVDRLEREGLLQRRPDPRDRRVSLIFLTEAGQARLLAITPAYFRALSDALAQVPAAQKAALRDQLHALLGPQEVARVEQEVARSAALWARATGAGEAAPSSASSPPEVE